MCGFNLPGPFPEFPRFFFFTFSFLVLITQHKRRHRQADRDRQQQEQTEEVRVGEEGDPPQVQLSYIRHEKVVPWTVPWVP